MVQGLSEGQALCEGQVIAERYQLERKLGAGGMGEVWIASHTEVGRRVALKVMRAEKAGRDAPRFRREAMALGKIDSPHVTSVLDAGTDAATGARFLVMELLQGEDIEKLVARLGPLPPQLALRIVLQALAGLGAAHAQGIVHRDIKPANLFLAKRGDGERVVKVLDFGIVKLVGEAGAEAGKALTATGSALGSAPFMSPEQLRGGKDIDQRSDLWSIGVTLYETLAGRMAFDLADLGQIVFAICFGAPMPLRQVAPWVPPEVASIVVRAMTREVGDRFQSAEEMANAIKPLLRGAPAITEELLVSLPEEVRSRVGAAHAGAPAVELAPVAQRAPQAVEPASSAQRTDVLSGPPAMSASPAGLPSMPLGSAAAPAPMSAQAVMSAVPTSGAGATVVSGPRQSPRTSRQFWGFVAIVVLVLGIAVVAGVLWLVRGASSPVSTAGASGESSSTTSTASVSGATSGGTTATNTGSASAEPVASATPPTSASAPTTSSAKGPTRGPQRTTPTSKSTSDAFGSGNK